MRNIRWRRLIRGAFVPLTGGNINDPSARQDRLEWRSAYATLAILIGIFGEILALFAFSHPDINWLEKGLLIVCNLLIGAGLVIEYFCIVGTIETSTAIKAESDRLVGEANQKSFEAIARASEANRIAEEERHARVRIEIGLASRQLTTEQSSKLASALSNVKAQIPVLQISRLGDKEAHDFANDILASVEESGILVTIADMDPPEFLKQHGLKLSDTPDGLLMAAFESAGIKIDDHSTTNANAIPIIWVWLKLPPF